MVGGRTHSEDGKAAGFLVFKNWLVGFNFWEVCRSRDNVEFPESYYNWAWPSADIKEQGNKVIFNAQWPEGRDTCLVSIKSQYFYSWTGPDVENKNSRICLANSHNWSGGPLRFPSWEPVWRNSVNLLLVFEMVIFVAQVDLKLPKQTESKFTIFLSVLLGAAMTSVHCDDKCAMLPPLCQLYFISESFGKE